MAQALIQQVKIPSSTRPAEVSSNGTAPQEDEPSPILPGAISAWIQGPYAHAIGEPLQLDARGSYSIIGNLTKYEWDLNGDGEFEITTSEPMLTHTWDREFVGNIRLRVTGPDGLTDTATTEAMITNDGDSTPYSQDNCPEVNNHGQTDYDGDGIGDECDPNPGIPTEDLPGVTEGPEPPSSPSPNPAPSTSPKPTPAPRQTPAPSPSSAPKPTPSTSPSTTPSSSPSTSPTLTEPTTSQIPTSAPVPTLSPTDPVIPHSPTATPVSSPTGSLEPSNIPPSRPGSPDPTKSSRPGLPKTGG